ncbi:RNA polymerase, sigma-24 subunit, ECF subfamily protein [metagenome]|uniref:RNA polymerase, sigma-24 subunit, ECF subfamily protein n=1 Tax=metagenome TaxID=256318 RepID=A0A2P2C5B9_9ZZZZ
MSTVRTTAFDDFVTATTPRLFRVAWAITGDYHLAEDALQAAYVSAYSRWRRISQADNPEAYVRRMVVNQVLGWRRRASFGERPSARLPDLRVVESAEADVDRSDVVWRGIQALAPRQRAIVVLRYYEQLSEAEIAETLGIRPGTVKSQASAALANLRLLLAAEGASFEGEPA